MTTREQLRDFQTFADEQLGKHDDQLSLDELYSLWRSRNPAPVELVESVDALNAAYVDIQAGEPGVPAREALRQSCERLGLVIGP